MFQFLFESAEEWNVAGTKHSRRHKDWAPLPECAVARGGFAPLLLPMTEILSPPPLKSNDQLRRPLVLILNK